MPSFACKKNGAALGLRTGVVAAVLGTDGFGPALAAACAALAFAVARFRIVRAVFLAPAPAVPLRADRRRPPAPLHTSCTRRHQDEQRREGVEDEPPDSDQLERPEPVIPRRGPRGRQPAPAGRHVFFKATRQPPPSTLFPYTTLFR